MKQDPNDLVIQAQRKLREITLDFGSEFASRYRRRIDDLCQEILNGLENKNKTTLDRAQTDLQNTLYELDREVQSQYNNDDFYFPNFRFPHN